MESLVKITLTFPPELDTPEQKNWLRDMYESEGRRARELAEAGILKRLWRLPGQTANIGLYETENLTQLHEILLSWPMYRYMAVEVTVLAENIKDPDVSPDRFSFAQYPQFEQAMKGPHAREKIHGQ